MPENLFVNRLHEQQKSKCHVRVGVLASAGNISAAREAGIPLHAIYRALKAEGLPVGSRPSSFYSAVKWLDRNGWGEVTSRPAEHIASPVSVQPDPAVPAGPKRHNPPSEAALAKPASSFTDNRYVTDFP